jgi:hypothetical protein
MDDDFVWWMCLVMKMGFVIVEYQDLETHLNRINDLTGSRVKMLDTTPSGRRSKHNVGFFVE